MKPNLFERIKIVSENQNISEEDIKEMTARIIDVFKEKTISYGQAYDILDITFQTLKDVSKIVSL